MDSWDEEVRRFMLEEEEEDDELFLVLVPHFNWPCMMKKSQRSKCTCSFISMVKLVYTYSVQMW